MSPTHDSTDVEDAEFFLHNVIFKAESTLFCVPREYLTREGGIFESMFSMPNLQGEGTGKENPIILPAEVSAADFRSFCKACLPEQYSLSPRHLTVEEWMSVLKLSTKWCLDELRVRAIENADEQVKAMPDVVDRVLCGKRYKISRWLIDGYEILGKRAEFLTAAEEAKLGLETAIRLSELREKSWTWLSACCDHAISRSRPIYDRSGKVSGYTAPSLPSRANFDFGDHIRFIFVSELLQDSEFVEREMSVAGDSGARDSGPE